MKSLTADRRRFLSITAFGAAGLAGPVSFMLTKRAAGDDDDDDDDRRDPRKCGTLTDSPFGPVSPVNDQTTGLPLIQLPRGFTYQTFSWNGDVADDGNQIIRGHDGMAVVSAQVVGGGRRRRGDDDGDDDGSGGRGRGRLKEAVLIRNHETFTDGEAKQPICTRPDGTSDNGPLYDPAGGGGTVALTFRNGRWDSHRVSICGTTANCAGGVTPWGTWVTCEEEVTLAAENPAFQKDHGFIYESLPTRTTPVPIPDAGLFKHESIVVDPRDGTVYLTEDNSSSGLDGTRGASGWYRYTPNNPLGGVGSLNAGGTLEALQAVDRDGRPVADLRDPECFSSYRTRWVPVPDPVAPPVGGVSGPFLQALANGATRFQRLEGSWYDSTTGEVVFCDTEGGPRDMASQGTGDRNGRGEGAVWRYDPRTGRLRNVFVSADREAADSPDNLTVDPKGNVFLCEDGQNANDLGLSLLGLKENGQVFEFARNNIVLTRAELEAAGKNADAILGEGADGPVDFRSREWAGATFDPSGAWLFVNIQDPGITFAITGPWGRLAAIDDDDD